MTVSLTGGLASAAGGPPDACTVLRRNAIESVVGADVSKSKREQATPRSASICNWDVERADSGRLVSVWVQRGKPARAGYRTAEDLFGDAGERLRDLGKRAFYSADAGTVYVLEGSTLLHVQRLDATGGTASEELREQTIRLTELALERLEA